MNLDDFSSQLESMHRRILQLCPAGLEGGRGDFRLMWEEAAEAFGVTMEEMRVAEEELREQDAELQSTRKAIEDERHRYRELFDFAPDAYLVTDLNGMIREANRAAGELLGRSPKYLVGRPLASQVAFDDRAAFRGGLARLLRVGRREDWVIRLGPKDEPAFDVSVTAAVVRDGLGSPMGLRWLIREVVPDRRGSRVTIGLPDAAADDLAGERRGRLRAEDEARMLRGLLDGLDLIVWEADAATGRYWYISPRAERVLGYPLESWTDDPGFWSEILHAEDRPLAVKQRGRLLGDGKGGELEYRVLAADGRVVWFREAMSVECDDRGEPRVIRGCLWDITRRKKIERQLYTDRQRLAAHLSDVWHLYLLGGQLLATLDLSVVLEEILSSVSSLQGAEMGAIRLLDRERSELEAVVSLGLPPGYLERFGRIAVGDDQACGLAVRRGEAVIVGDVAADDLAAACWAEAAAAGGFRACFSVPLVSRRGELLGTIATFFREPHRPSERQRHLIDQYVLQAADALDNARKHQDVRDGDRRKAEFLATLAHELRNPLSAIHTSAHLLAVAGADAEMLAEARELIVRQVKHMSRLVEDVLDATRVHRGAIVLRKEPVELADVVARAVSDVRPLIDARRHELAVSIPEEPVMLVADATRLEQVLANLLTNAAKYTDPGGHIGLTAVREPSDLVVAVRDDGIGLSPEALSGLFQLFSQVDAGHDRSRAGLGIGLALVKSLVELHGGSVWATSDGPGRGSEFTVRLPL